MDEEQYQEVTHVVKNVVREALRSEGLQDIENLAEEIAEAVDSTLRNPAVDQPSWLG